MSSPFLGGESTAIVGDYAKALMQEENHLRIPIVGRKRPTVTENGLPFAPILVVDLRTVFGGDGVDVVYWFLC